MLFHHDNGPANMSPVVAAKFHDLHFKLLPHGPYFPDLVPRDYFLFPNLKIWLPGQKFTLNDEVKADMRSFYRVGQILLH